MSWNMIEKDWPWNKSYGKNKIIEVDLRCGRKIRISATEIIEACGLKFVEAHLECCKKELSNQKKWQYAKEVKGFSELKYSAVCAELEEAQKEIEKLKSGLDSVAELIDCSTGVVGLHLNGEVAEWSDLLSGGHFEAWLVDFDEALNGVES